MRRTWMICLGVAGTLCFPCAAWAADPLVRGPGFYLAWWKLLLWWLLFAYFVRLAAWINRDCQEIGERYGLDTHAWNSVFVFTFLGVFLISCFAIPIFFAGYPVAIVGLFVPLLIYVSKRNKVVMEDMRVLTPKHIKNWFSNLGKHDKKPVVVKLPHEMGPSVEFTPKGAADDQANQANIITARQMPGFVAAKELIADAFDNRADRIMVDYTREAVAVRFEIDGVWQNGPARDRETADQFLAVFKKLCNANPTDRRNRQQGIFGCAYPDPKPRYDVELISQGTQTGERLVLKVERGLTGLESLEKLGMREPMRTTLASYLRGDKGGGVILVSAMPAGGMTTTWTAVLKSTDRMLRDFVCIEDVNQRTPYVENVEVHKYNAAAGETPDAMLPKLMLKQPDVFVLPEFQNAETVRILCREAIEENRLIIAGVRSKDAIEALMRVLLLKAPSEEFAQAVKAVVNVRLIRRLSETCKQPYQPPPALLQKLGIPAGRVKELYREWQPNAAVEIQKKKLPPGACETCGIVGVGCRGLFYRGRTGIFELLEVTDALREALVREPTIETLRQVAKKGGHRGLQDEGVLLVAQGVTSLNELQRVMKL